MKNQSAINLQARKINQAINARMDHKASLSYDRNDFLRDRNFGGAQLFENYSSNFSSALAVWGSANSGPTVAP